ncbi:MAG: hypothetical protein ACKO23_21305, partial [Gemmataceae bacterium]
MKMTWLEYRTKGREMKMRFQGPTYSIKLVAVALLLVMVSAGSTQGPNSRKHVSFQAELSPFDPF